jgi:hypothetical protein
MTKKKLNTYTPEFKESAIKLALDSSVSTSNCVYYSKETSLPVAFE